jgi:hypothetical protein
MIQNISFPLILIQNHWNSHSQHFIFSVVMVYPPYTDFTESEKSEKKGFDKVIIII